MKRIFTLLMMALISGTVFSQDAPWTMSYQAIVRNSSNQLLPNNQVGVRISVLGGIPSGDTLYAETHTATTNINGLLELEIGAGTQVFGWFSYEFIPWGSGPYYLKTEIDPEGGTYYTITSTSKMLSVPHSNYSHWSGTLTGWSSKYTGTYQALFEPTFYLIITYVTHDKVMITVIDNEEYILVGTASENQIIIPETDVGDCFWSGSITVAWDELTLNIQEVCGGEVFEGSFPYVKF